MKITALRRVKVGGIAVDFARRCCLYDETCRVEPGRGCVAGFGVREERSAANGDEMDAVQREISHIEDGYRFRFGSLYLIGKVAVIRAIAILQHL